MVLLSLEPESTKGEWEVEYRNQLNFIDLKLSVGYMDICLIIFFIHFSMKFSKMEKRNTHNYNS